MAKPPLLPIRLTTALLLPLLVLASVWATTYHLAQQGQDWLIPIHGYDPMDPLRGPFIRYRYDWPSGDAAKADHTIVPRAFDPAYADQLCIEGIAPNIRRVHAVGNADQSGERTGCAILVRAALGARPEARGLEQGIFYLSQSRAGIVSRKLADPTQQAFVRVRIRSDGVMRPVALEFTRRKTG